MEDIANRFEAIKKTVSGFEDSIRNDAKRFHAFLQTGAVQPAHTEFFVVNYNGEVPDFSNYRINWESENTAGIEYIYHEPSSYSDALDYYFLVPHDYFLNPGIWEASVEDDSRHLLERAREIYREAVLNSSDNAKFTIIMPVAGDSAGGRYVGLKVEHSEKKTEEFVVDTFDRKLYRTTLRNVSIIDHGEGERWQVTRTRNQQPA